MKKWLALCAGAACTMALAGTQFTGVPQPLHKALGNHNLKTAQLNAQGVLRVQVDKPVLSELVYATFIYNGICAEQWRQPERFAALALTRVEVLDAAGAQGFAFDASGGVCEQMGQMGQNYRTLINGRSVPCSAGVCPAPR